MTRHVTIQRGQVPLNDECEIREMIHNLEEKYGRSPEHYAVINCFYCRLFDGIGIDRSGEYLNNPMFYVRCDGTDIVDGQDIGRALIEVD